MLIVLNNVLLICRYLTITPLQGERCRKNPDFVR